MFLLPWRWSKFTLLQTRWWNKCVPPALIMNGKNNESSEIIYVFFDRFFFSSWNRNTFIHVNLLNCIGNAISVLPFRGIYYHLNMISVFRRFTTRQFSFALWTHIFPFENKLLYQEIQFEIIWIGWHFQTIEVKLFRKNVSIISRNFFIWNEIGNGAKTERHREREGQWRRREKNYFLREEIFQLWHLSNFNKYIFHVLKVFLLFFL